MLRIASQASSSLRPHHYKDEEVNSKRAIIFLIMIFSFIGVAVALFTVQLVNAKNQTTISTISNPTWAQFLALYNRTNYPAPICPCDQSIQPPEQASNVFLTIAFNLGCYQNMLKYYNNTFTVIMCDIASQAVNNRWTSVDSTIPTQNFRNATYYLDYYVESWIRACQSALLDLFVTSYLIDNSYAVYQNITHLPANGTYGSTIMFNIWRFGFCNTTYAPTVDNISTALGGALAPCVEGECLWKWFWGHCQARQCTYQSNADLLTEGLAVVGALGPIWTVITICGTILYGFFVRQERSTSDKPDASSIALSERSVDPNQEMNETQEKLPS